MKKVVDNLKLAWSTTSHRQALGQTYMPDTSTNQLGVTLMSFEFVIEDGVSIPKREIEFAPRGSQYPFEQMKAGQSFLIPVHGEEGATKKDGTPLTVAEDAKRKAAQKQSYFSSLGKKLGINVVTRFFPEGEDSQSDPSLRVWHNGPRTAEQLAKDAQTASAQTDEQEQEEPVSEDGAEFADELNLGDE